MPAPSTSWNLVRVYGTWRTQAGDLRPGTYKVTIPARITNVTDDAIIPAGTFSSGDLQTSVGASPSLDVLVPATDDPDNAETGWKVVIEVTFPSATGEKYVIDVPVANRPIVDGGSGVGVNLRTVVLSASIPQQVALYRVGEPGGLAQLNEAGEVIDSDGNPVTGSGDVNADDVTDGATKVQMLTTERAKLAGVATNATANDTDANLRDRGTHTGTQAQSTITNLTTDLGNKQPIDTDLSAIAALTTTSFGRGLLALADAAALRTSVGAASETATGVIELATTTEATTGTDTTRAVTAAGLAAVKAALKTEILGAGVPAALDTLDELAAALGDDANFAATVTTSLSNKQPLDSDLTSIAALSTTTYGRAFLALADQAALMGLVAAASETAQGKVELATTAEAITGSDTARAVTPAGLKAAHPVQWVLQNVGGTWPARPTSDANQLTFFKGIAGGAAPAEGGSGMLANDVWIRVP